MSEKVNICIVLTTRGNYAKMKSTMHSINMHERLNLQVVLGGGILLNRFREYEEDLIKDGFDVQAKIDFLVNNGSTPADMARSSANAIQLLTGVLGEIKPDVIIVIADRYEALAIAMTAMCLNIPIAHLEGGEVSGSIDERIRHAITKLSHIHFPSNSDSADRIIKLGESLDSIFIVGSPSIDRINNIDLDDTDILESSTILASCDANFDFTKPYFVVSQHPVVTEYESINIQIDEIIRSVVQFEMPVIWILPNMDAGNNEILIELEKNKEILDVLPTHIIPSLSIEEYSVLLKNSSCLIGNSSSGIRECEFMGVPVINIGTRQNNRVVGKNIIHAEYNNKEITEGIIAQLKHGHYNTECIYGDGHSGEKIADILSETNLRLEKTITY